MLTIGWIMLGVTALAATENTFCPDGNYTSATVPTSGECKYQQHIKQGPITERYKHS